MILLYRLIFYTFTDKHERESLYFTVKLSRSPRYSQ